MIYDYGAITREDAEVLELVLSRFKAKPVKFLELGVYTGGTARGVRDFCAAQGSKLEYYGVESGTLCVPTPPFPEANLIIGESWDVFFKVPDGLDCVICDACHTFNAVVLDTVHYSRKVNSGGFMLFHDTAYHVQGKLSEPNRNWPDHPWFKNAVNDALEAIHWPFPGWTQFAQSANPRADYGGFTAFRKG